MLHKEQEQQRQSELFNFIDEREKEYKEQKQCVHFRLQGDTKFYYAFHCHQYCTFIKENGYGTIGAERIKDVYCKDWKIVLEFTKGGIHNIKYFDNKSELLGYVVGFTECIADIKEYGVYASIS